MTTPAIMLGLLVAPLLITTLWRTIRGRLPCEPATAGCWGVALVFWFTGVGHFIRTAPMAEMLPPWVPARVPLVYLTGFIELAAAVAILIPRCRRVTGMALIAMLVAFLPVNILAAVNRVPMGGHAWGPIYLLVRAPLQAVLIGWIAWFTTRSKGGHETP